MNEKTMLVAPSSYDERIKLALEAEFYLNATLVAYPDKIAEIDIDASDFLDREQATIFSAIRRLYEEGRAVSAPSVIELVVNKVNHDTLRRTLDPIYATPWDVKNLARIIRESAYRRRVTETGRQLIDIANQAEDQESLWIEVERVLLNLSRHPRSDEEETQLIRELLPDYLDNLQKRSTQSSKLLGADTGFRKLNYYTGGWVPGTLNIVAARPSVGKTAFMIQSAAAVGRNDIAVVFSLEMDKKSLLDRFLASEALMPMYNVTHGRIKGNDWEVISHAFDKLNVKHVYLNDMSSITISAIRAQLRRIVLRMPSDKKLVVFIDYLQLIRPERSAKGRTRNEELGEISSELKALARDFDCSVVALSQLSRRVDERVDKRPMLSDIRESGQIEQDADVILLLYRDDYYDPSSTENKDVLEIIIGKNRNGPVGTIKTKFLREYQHIAEIVDSDYRG